MPPKKDTTKKTAPKKAAAKKSTAAKSKSPAKSTKSLSLYAGGEAIMGYNVKEKALKPMDVKKVCIHKVRGREKKDGTRGPSREVYRLAGEDSKTGQAMSVMSNEWSALNLVEYNKQHGIKIPIVKCESKPKPPKKEKAEKPKKKPAAKKAEGEKKPKKSRAKKAEVTVEGEDVKVETEGPVDVVIKAPKKKATPKKETEAKPKKTATKKKATPKKETEAKPKKTTTKKKATPKKETEEKPKKKATKRVAKK